MKGSNTLELNELTLITALQLYFDTVLFREGCAPKVVSIAKTSSTAYGHENAFTVNVTEPAKP